VIACLTIQILLERAPDFDRQVVLDALHGAERFPEIDEDERGAWVAFNLFTEDLSALWTQLHPVLAQSELAAVLSQAGIIVCEAEQGSGERVLFHHDSAVPLDSLP
tara:strand:+ start:163 stop:480 length:318 start_codon:yes stop_codon:yes gene_type:complete